jgi:hypothetical protein
MPKFIHVSICIFLLCVSIVAQTRQQEKTAQVRGHYEAAQAFERAGDWAGAEREWQQTLKFLPNDARIWVNLGVALNRQERQMKPWLLAKLRRRPATRAQSRTVTAKEPILARSSLHRRSQGGK